jgi:hypothetical protein
MYQDPNSIVTVQVNTILGPLPSAFQQTGAILSFGATNVATNSTKFLTQFTDLAPLLNPGGTVATATWATNIVTVGLGTVHLPAAITPGSTVLINFTGFTPTTFNGQFLCTVVTNASVTYAQPITPGTMTTAGQWQLNSTSMLNAQVATFYRQGTAVGIYVLELGYQTSVATEVSAMTAWLNNNPTQFYAYLVPDYWGTTGNVPTVLPLYQQFTSPSAMQYFFTTISLAAIGLIPNSVKCVLSMIEAPTVAAARQAALPNTFAEFTMAGMFYLAMAFKATSVTRVAPMCFKYIYGVTPYPTANNGPTLVSFKTNHVNYIQTGAQGGIAFTNVYQGVTEDGQDFFNWWWTIDWVQININLNISNAVINGANNPLAPLYYDQLGINYLEGILAATMSSASQFGMVNGIIVQTQYNQADLAQQIQLGTFTGRCDVNAVPFLAYSLQNPGDYGKGEYDGLSTLFVPARGFIHILVVVVATNLISP